MGLASEQGGTPAEKNGKNSVDYPWGLGFPPNGKVGNYGDTAFYEKFAKAGWLEYTDGYATTAPEQMVKIRELYTFIEDLCNTNYEIK